MDSDLLSNEKTVSFMFGDDPEEVIKAPDCVCQTIIKRMEELNEEISDCERLLNTLKAEYIAHANFIKNGPLEHKNLSHSSVNMIERPQPSG